MLNPENNKKRRAEALILVGVILCLMTLPSHFHIHYFSDSHTGALENAIDLHITNNSTDLSHHEDSPTLKSTVDAQVKKILKVFNEILLISWYSRLAMLPMFNMHSVAIMQSRQSISQYYYINPPQRAPPSLSLVSYF